MSIRGADDRRAAGRVREHPHESVLGHRAGGPAKLSMVREPVVRQIVVHVIGIEQGDEQVHVKERRARHASSLSSFTRCIVSFGEPARRAGRSGTPLRTAAFRGWRRPRLASADSTWPAVRRRGRGEFLGGLQHVVVDVERGAHDAIITHHASGVNRGRTLRAWAPGANARASRRRGAPSRVHERSSRRSHILATFQSRTTVSADRPSAEAVSSTVMPPK